MTFLWFPSSKVDLRVRFTELDLGCMFQMEIIWVVIFSCQIMLKVKLIIVCLCFVNMQNSETYPLRAEDRMIYKGIYFIFSLYI